MGESPPLFVPEPLNNRLWHIPFNRVNDELTEQLVRGREDIFFGYEFAIQGGGKTLPDYALKYYFRLFSDPDILRGSFGFYRAWDTTLAQNVQRATRPLAMPVLAIGGAESWGERVGNLATDDVQIVVIPGVGHWVAEQAPEEMLAALTAFLAPYRDGSAAARDSARSAAMTRRGSRPGGDSDVDADGATCKRASLMEGHGTAGTLCARGPIRQEVSPSARLINTELLRFLES